MPLHPQQIKKLVKDRGWVMVDVAARWGVSVTWMSRLVNDRERSQHYDDAFTGLPQREVATVVREPRHVRKAGESKGGRSRVGQFELFPVGRVLVAEDNQHLEEGTRVVVAKSTAGRLKAGTGVPLLTLRVTDSDHELQLSQDEVVHRFADTGLHEDD